MSEQETGGSVTYGPGTLVCAAPGNAAMRVSFFKDCGCLIGGETVAAGETRIIAPLGVSFSVEVMPDALIAEDANVRAWLERQADHYMQSGTFTSDNPLGVAGFGVRFSTPARHLSAESMYEKFKPGALVFYAVWLGTEITTERRP